MGGENAKKNFSRNTQISQPNNDGKNHLEKVRKLVFYKHTNIVTKKWGEKTREKIFPETHVYRDFYRWKKSSGKSAKTRFFINT